MDIDNRNIRHVKQERFDSAATLNSIEALAVVFDELDIPYDEQRLQGRSTAVQSGDIKAILTAMWLREDREEMHEDAVEVMEQQIRVFAPTEQ